MNPGRPAQASNRMRPNRVCFNYLYLFDKKICCWLYNCGRDIALTNYQTNNFFICFLLIMAAQPQTERPLFLVHRIVIVGADKYSVCQIYDNCYSSRLQETVEPSGGARKRIEDYPAASCRESSPVRKWSFYIRSLIPQQAAGNALADAVQASPQPASFSSAMAK